MVGDRVDLDIDREIDFADASWADQLRSQVAASGKEHGTLGSDYFVFPRDGELTQLNGLAVGRPGWDNWFIYHARSIGVPVINASAAIRVIHQNHDYAHVPRQSGHTSDGKSWNGPEATKQKQLIGAFQNTFTPDDATHVLSDRGLRRAWNYESLVRRWRRWPEFNPHAARFVRAGDKLLPKSVKRLCRTLLAN
jgi:hypothetical protein